MVHDGKVTVRHFTFNKNVHVKVEATIEEGIEYSYHKVKRYLESYVYDGRTAGNQLPESVAKIIHVRAWAEINL